MFYNIFTKEHEINYKGIDIKIPKGLRVKKLGQRYLLDEFPSNLFPAYSIQAHYAINYGLGIPSNLIYRKKGEI